MDEVVTASTGVAPGASPPAPSSPETRSNRRWRRELREVVRLAAPVVGVQLGMMLMGTVDSMVLGRLSETALAAGALGNAVSFAFLVLGMGLLMGLDPLISQAWGAGARDRLARSLRRGLVLAALLTPPIAAVIGVVGAKLEWLGQPAALAASTEGYLLAILPGVPAFLIFVVLRQTLQGMAIVRPALWAILIANLFNLVADIGLVFGRWGLPALGVTGSGLATSASRWVMAVALFVFAWPVLSPYLGPAGRGAVTREGMKVLLRVGGPIALAVSLELYVFTAVSLMMGHLGTRELAAHQIALNIASLSFMVPLGIGAAAATRVGNAIGRGDSDGVRLAARVTVVLGAVVMSGSAIVFFLFPRALARLYTDEAAVIGLAALLLPIAAVFQIADGTQVVGAGVLRGAADTRVPALIALVGFWGIGLPLGAWLAFSRDRGPQGLWWGLTAGLVVVAGLLVWRMVWRLRGELEAVDVGD